MTGTWKFFTETSGARLPMKQISFWFMFIIIAIGVFSSGTKYLLYGLFCLTDNYKLTKVLCNHFFFIFIHSHIIIYSNLLWGCYRRILLEWQKVTLLLHFSSRQIIWHSSTLLTALFSSVFVFCFFYSKLPHDWQQTVMMLSVFALKKITVLNTKKSWQQLDSYWCKTKKKS